QDPQYDQYGKDNEYRGVAVSMYQQVLQRLTAAADVDYEMVSEVVRNLLSLAGGNDAARLEILKELAALLAGAVVAAAAAAGTAGGGPQTARGGAGRGRGSSYPPLEMEALVSSTWNRGAHHARFGRLRLALDHLRTALALLRYSPTLDLQNRSWMAEQVEAMEARLTAATARGAEIAVVSEPCRGAAAATVGVQGDDVMDGWVP
ncbi:hypothetical protein VaNZ11_016321, partial [Volvox africanus]